MKLKKRLPESRSQKKERLAADRDRRELDREQALGRREAWLAQHDVDIIDDHRIAIFNNNAFDRGKGWYIDGVNDVTFYDFASDEVSSPYRAAMAELDVKTLTEGLFDFTAQGRLILEEENSGRLLIVERDGKPLTEFINRAKDGNIYELGWSRYVPQALGDAALATLSEKACTKG